MRQTRTRILSLLLALVMCLGLLPVTALAAGGSSGEPSLFLDPEQEGVYSSSWSEMADPFFQMQGLEAGKPEPTTYTVQLLDQDSGRVIEVGNRYEGEDSIDLRNRYSRIGYDFVSIAPETTHSYDPNTKILTYQVHENIDIIIRSYYLDFDYFFW